MDDSEAQPWWVANIDREHTSLGQPETCQKGGLSQILLHF